MPEPQRVALVPLLAEVLHDQQLAASQKQVALILHPIPDEAVVSGDPALLRRALDNLVSNAIKYMSNDGRVMIKVACAPDSATISIIDNGFGIPAADLPHVFEPFYRVRQRAHQRQEGTGLGLSIVKAIVEQHDGSIQITSTPEQGSIFTVRLPLFRQMSQSAPVTGVPLHAKAAGSPLPEAGGVNS